MNQNCLGFYAEDIPCNKESNALRDSRLRPKIGKNYTLASSSRNRFSATLNKDPGSGAVGMHILFSTSFTEDTPTSEFCEGDECKGPYLTDCE